MLSNQKKISNTEKVSILFIWDVREPLKKYFLTKLSEHLNKVNLLFVKPFSHKKTLEIAPDADIIIGWRPKKDLLQAAQKLQLFINPGAGVQHLIDLFKEINKDRRVILINGHGNASFTAQHAIALLLTITNHILIHHNWLHDGKWRKGDNDARSLPLENRIIGLLGFGHVNRKVLQFLSGFNPKVSIFRQSWNNKKFSIPSTARKYEPDQLHEFLTEIDTLIIAIPQTSKIIDLIGYEELELLGKTGIVINVGRGTVINQKALFTCLNEKKIAFAGIDVWYNYQPQPDIQGRLFPWSKQFPFHKLENIILSPHRGASPMNDLKRWDRNIENIIRFVLGNDTFSDVVNLDREY